MALAQPNQDQCTSTGATREGKSHPFSISWSLLDQQNSSGLFLAALRDSSAEGMAVRVCIHAEEKCFIPGQGDSHVLRQ